MAKPPAKNPEDAVLGVLDCIDPQDMIGFQRQVFNIVREQLPRAREVMRGSRKWDNNQTKIFLAMLSKTLPDISVSRRYSEHTMKNITELSTDQLRAIVAAAEAQIVDATPAPEPDQDLLPSPIMAPNQ